jgi:UDP-glucose 6-dehydrogenase
VQFQILSNPNSLAEGTVEDLLNPDRILIEEIVQLRDKKQCSRSAKCMQIGFLLIKY